MVSASVVTSVWPMVAALVEAEKMPGMGQDRIWRPGNGINAGKQKIFLSKYFGPLRNKVAGISEMRSVSSRSADEINLFLRREGFNIQLDQFEPNEFGMASILDLILEWVREGTRKSIIEYGTGKEYPAGARIGLESDNLKFYKSSAYEFPIAELKTRDARDRVFLTIAPRAPVDAFDLMAMVDNIRSNKKPHHEFGGIHFPMASLQQEEDISWMLGVNTIGSDNQPAWISQALMEVIARLNHKGVQVKIAAAVGVQRCCIQPKVMEDMVIDRPYLLWIERTGLEGYPLACAYIAQTDWKYPESLD